MFGGFGQIDVQKPYSCIYFVSVDMFVGNLVQSNRIVFFPALQYNTQIYYSAAFGYT